MFHNSTAIRSSLRGSGKGGWPRDELSTIDKDQTLIQLTNNEELGKEKEDGIFEVNLIPSSTLNLVHDQGRMQTGGGYPHNSTGVHPISGPMMRTIPLWPGEDLSTINNGDNGTRDNWGNGVANLLDPTHQSIEEDEISTFSLDQLGPTPPELDTFSGSNITQSDVSPPFIGVEGGGSPQENPIQLPLKPQRKEMAVDGVLQLPTKEICMGSRVRDINLRVKYGTQEPIVLRMDLHRLMHLLRLISSPTTPSSSSSSISSGSDSQQQVPEIDQGPMHKRKRRPPGPSIKPKVILPKPTRKVDQNVVGGVPRNSPAKAGEKDGWRYSCYFCTKLFSDQPHLNRHISIHTTEKPFPCDQCTQRFAQNTDLTKHKRVHALDPAIRRPFKCQECGQSFTKSGNLNRHVKIIHRGVKEYKCLKCDKMFGSKCDMIRHHDSIHLGIRHPCSKSGCGKTFSQKRHLRQHEKQFHPKMIVQRGGIL